MKKKTLLAIVGLVMLLTLVLAVTVAAEGCPPPPPPPCTADCSPGFWKNHTELWAADFAADFDWMYAGLTAKGWESHRPDRWVATDILNAAYPDAPCD